MANGGARLDDLPLDVLYDIGYAELYRQTEMIASTPVFDDKAKEHPLEAGYERIDQSIRDSDMELPAAVLAMMPRAADGTSMEMPDVSPPAVEPMPPPGAKPGKPLPEG